MIGRVVHTLEGPVTLANMVGRGGEGEVYAVADGSGRMVKLYLKPDDERRAKVRAMVDAKLAERCPVGSFPLGQVTDDRSMFLGFTMRGARGEPIHQLHSPRSRRKLFAQATYPFLVGVGRNLALAVAQVHAAKVVIGDINHSSILIADDARVALIDADSMAFAGHRCRVGVPEYTAPEIQDRPLGTVERTEAHDRFGLAVMIFQLLALGRHPFSCVARREMPLPRAIAEHRFAFSLIHDHATRPPNSVSLEDLSAPLRLAFELAFGRELKARPSAREWAHALDAYARSLVSCSRDPRHHHRPRDRNCPWCRIETRAAPVFCRTLQCPHRVPEREVDDGKYSAAIASMRQFVAKRIEPAGRTKSASPSAAATGFVENRWLEHRRLLADLPSGGALSDDRFTRAYLAARANLEARLSEWRARIGLWRLEQLIAAIERGLGDLQILQTAAAGQGTDPLAAARARHVDSVLRSATLADAPITVIGRARLAALAVRFPSALDCRKQELLRVPGLGATRVAALLIWRLRVEADATIAADRLHHSGVPAGDRNATEWSAWRTRARAKIDGDIVEAKLLQKTIMPALFKADAPVSEARRAVEACKADLRHLGLPIP